MGWGVRLMRPCLTSHSIAQFINRGIQVHLGKTSLHIYLSICLPTHTPTCPLTCLPIYLYILPSICLSLYVNIYLVYGSPSFPVLLTTKMHISSIVSPHVIHEYISNLGIKYVSAFSEGGDTLLTIQSLQCT